jgi:hypothetical protein
VAAFAWKQKSEKITTANVENTEAENAEQVFIVFIAASPKQNTNQQ